MSITFEKMKAFSDKILQVVDVLAGPKVFLILEALCLVIMILLTNTTNS